MKLRTFFHMACEEPFRIFFPLGLLAGVSGVLLWPLYFTGIHEFYPGVMHARMMIQGFLGAFIFGFLGTAGPRLSDTRNFSGVELCTLLVLYLASEGLHIASMTGWGDACFLALLLAFIGMLGSRLFRTAGQLPPGFVLVAIGFLSGVVGNALLVAGWLGAISPRLIFFGATLLNEAWVLFLILGVGSFLMPRFLNLSPAVMRRNTGNWNAAALRAAGAGAIILLSYGLQIFGVIPPGIGATVRFLTAAIFLVIQTGALKPPSLTMMRSFYTAMLLTIVGLLFPLLSPGQRMAGLHLIFIGGFALLTLTVATRVILGHSGNGHLFRQKLPFLSSMALLFVGAMVLRIGGDWMSPAWRSGTLSVASFLWIAGAIVWGWRLMPKVAEADPESLPSCSGKP